MKIKPNPKQFIRIISDFKQHTRFKNVVLACVVSVLLFACKDSKLEAVSLPRAQDDFYNHINKDWLANTEIPEELPGIENFSLLTLDVYQQLYDTYQELNKNTGNLKSYEQKFVNFFNSYMNQARRDSLGASAIQGELDRINSVKSHEEMALLFAEFQKIGIVGPIVITVFANPVKSDERTIAVLQYGIELTQQELLADDERSQKKRELYTEHVGNHFALTGIDSPEERASRAVGVEKSLAEIQWSPTENRDPRKKYNPHTEAEFSALLNNMPIPQMLKILGYEGRSEYIVQQPSYFKALNDHFVKTDLDAWKDYFIMKLLNERSAILSKAYDDENLAYKMKKGESAKSMESWLRGMLYVGDNADMMVGRVYIDHHFNEEKLQQITEIVKIIQDEYRIAITNNTLFSEATKKEAMDKLENMQFYVGYPKEWKDYSNLELDPNDLVGNVQRIALFNHNNTISDLSKPVDPDAWSNSPTEVNAYYQPSANKFVLMGSILQNPFFDSSWNKVRNIGGIGYIIGHEIGHGFDDQGRQFDAVGNMRDWWTEADKQKFIEIAMKAVKHADAYEILPGYHLNGKLELGEILGDINGLHIAHRASERIAKAEGMNLEEANKMFFSQAAQTWRSKYRKELQITLLETDGHPPGEYRVNGIFPNLDAFHDTYQTKPGDSMYMAPENRIKIW